MKAGQIIYRVALPVPLRKLFDYLPPETHSEIIARGTRVKVPFGRQQLVGIVMNHSVETTIPSYQLKAISSVCDPLPLFPENLCTFFEKTANYYHHPLGEVAFTGVPMAIRQGKPCDKTYPLSLPQTVEGLCLNPDQQHAVDVILNAQHQFQAFLLEGITGSGKTEVYLQVATHILNQPKQVLILVPEISLTPQTQQRFTERFGEAVVCYHSRMTPSMRIAAWLKVCQQQSQIVIGTRSAIFLPFQNLGLIVIDEEHDPSFKQQEGFRYSARDIAVLRAKMMDCPIILGSATPAFETLFNAKSGKYHWLHLRKRATSTHLPNITLLDVRHKKCEGGIAPPLLKSIEQHCSRGGQVLLFINRRGFAPTFMCYGCGWIAQCERCDSRLTFHHKKQVLICHHCLHQRRQPRVCPECQKEDLHPVGQGTERLENFLQEHFPHISMARIDSDATRKKGSLEQLLEAAQNKEVQILIGTQILAKGHHFPHLSLVAIVDADGGLFSVDFRAVERMAQLIIQVGGRAGRVHTAGEVIIQTLHPDHPLLKHILHQDYQQLSTVLLAERERCHLPPYSHLALIRAAASNPTLPVTLLKEVQDALFARNYSASILGPVPAPMYKRQGSYRYQLLLQSNERKPLHQMLSYTTTLLENSKLGKKVRWSVDVDPVEMF